jgi:hypothetical protein
MSFTEFNVETETFLYAKINKGLHVGILYMLGNVKFDLLGVGLSEVEYSKFQIEPGTESLYLNYIGKSALEARPIDLIRSAMIKISDMVCDKNYMSETNLLVSLKTDLPKSLENQLIEHLFVC